MIKAYTLIDTAAGTSEAACEAIRAIEGVTEAHVVAGDFDVIVELEGDRPHDLLRTVTSRIRPLEGVGTTRTYVWLDEPT